jgi:hypothetical protein
MIPYPNTLACNSTQSRVESECHALRIDLLPNGEP